MKHTGFYFLRTRSFRILRMSPQVVQYTADRGGRGWESQKFGRQRGVLSLLSLLYILCDKPLRRGSAGVDKPWKCPGVKKNKPQWIIHSRAIRNMGTGFFSQHSHLREDRLFICLLFWVGNPIPKVGLYLYGWLSVLVPFGFSLINSNCLGFFHPIKIWEGKYYSLSGILLCFGVGHSFRNLFFKSVFFFFVTDWNN